MKHVLPGDGPHGRGRAAELLWQVAHAVNVADNVEEAGAFCLRRVAEYDGWAFGHVLVRDDDQPDRLILAGESYPGGGRDYREFLTLTRRTALSADEGLPGKVFATAESAWSNDPAADLDHERAKIAGRLGLMAAAAIPVSVKSEIVGIMEFFATSEVNSGAGSRAVLSGVGNYLGRAFERAMLLKRLRYVSQAEQERIARELHDAVGQQLAALAMTADSIAGRLEGRAGSEALAVGELANGVRRALRAVRSVARGLPQVQPGRGVLARQLEALASEIDAIQGFRGVADCDATIDVRNSDTATHLFRIAQEAAHNAIEHSGATLVRISLSAVPDGALCLQVVDNGSGLSLEDVDADRGLRTMRRRAAIIGGQLSIEVTPGGGTSLRCIVSSSDLDR